MKVEGSGGGGGGAVVAPAKKRRGEAASVRRQRGGEVSVRRRARWRVQPDATPLQRLLVACRGAFGGPGTVPAPADVALIRGILDKIGPQDAHLSAIVSGLQRHPTITRTTIYSCKNFSIVIFFLPPGAVIPLHNHPGMTVLSKLLLGSLHVKSYDWAAGPPVAANDHPLTRLATVVLDADLSAPCDALVLYPDSGGNMHRFAAATPCAVLDVLGPPYSKDRDCTYYQELPLSHHDPDETGDVHVKDEQQKKNRLGWLKEMEKPMDLEMYEVPYRGPPIL